MLFHGATRKVELHDNSFVALGRVDEFNDVADLVISLLRKQLHFGQIMKFMRKLRKKFSKCDTKFLIMRVLGSRRSIWASA
jgi:hypothetical protein